MGSKKTQTTTNTPAWSAPPDTADMSSLRGLRDQGGDFATPIRNSYARAEQKRSNSYNNPLGAFTTADVRDKTLQEQNSAASQDMGMALGEAAQQNAQNKFGRYSQIAGMTAPQFYNAQSKTTNPFTAWDGIGLGLGGAKGILSSSPGSRKGG